MFENLFSLPLRVLTLPVDVANATLDIACGGDGSKRSRQDSPLAPLEQIRDRAAETLEDLDL